jgi:hypothetical protein
MLPVPGEGDGLGCTGGDHIGRQRMFAAATAASSYTTLVSVTNLCTIRSISEKKYNII